MVAVPGALVLAAAAFKLCLTRCWFSGWAYGSGGDRGCAAALWLAPSTGGPQEAYQPQGYKPRFFDAFLPPMEQTAARGMRFLPRRWCCNGAHHATPMPRQVAAHGELSCRAPAARPGWPEIDELPAVY